MAAGDVITLRENAGGRRANLFDGTDDYVLADAHAVARVAAADTTGTYTAWIYVDDIAGVYTILSAGDNNSATECLQFYATTNGVLSAKLYHGGANRWWTYTGTGELVAKTWTHVAVVQDGVQPKTYINGKNVAVSNGTTTALGDWYDKLTLVDKFAIGVKESNTAHTADFKGAIGQVKYWDSALSNTEILAEYNATSDGTAFGSHGTPALNITMENDGITDSGSGADNGSLTGDAHYGGEVSAHSQAVEANVTGHAAETITTFPQGSKYVSIIKRGD